MTRGRRVKVVNGKLKLFVASLEPGVATVLVLSASKAMLSRPGYVHYASVILDINIRRGLVQACSL